MKREVAYRSGHLGLMAPGGPQGLRRFGLGGWLASIRREGSSRLAGEATIGGKMDDDARPCDASLPTHGLTMVQTENRSLERSGG